LPHRRSNERLGALFPFDLDQAACISTRLRSSTPVSFGFTDILALHLNPKWSGLRSALWPKDRGRWRVLRLLWGLGITACDLLSKRGLVTAYRRSLGVG
jgi:hypothetical protein